MRASTPSFVVSVKVHLPEQIENHLEKSFNIANSAYNEVLGLGLRRIKAMRAIPRYQELLEARRTLAKSIKQLKKSKGLAWQIKLYDKALSNLRLEYGLSEFRLSKHLTHRRNEPDSPYKHLSSSELQVVAKEAYQTLEKVIFYKVKPHKVKFRSKFSLNARIINANLNNVEYHGSLSGTFSDVREDDIERYQLSYRNQFDEKENMQLLVGPSNIAVMQLEEQNIKLVNGETIPVGDITLEKLSSLMNEIVDEQPIGGKKALKLLDKLSEREILTDSDLDFGEERTL